MLEYLATIVIVLVLLAPLASGLLARRSRRGRRQRGIVALPFNTQLALGTLADETIAKVSLTTDLAEDFFAVSTDITVSVEGHTATEDPLGWGVAHDDYTVAELKEYVDANLTDPGQKIEQERARRKVRRGGVLHSMGGSQTELISNGGQEKRIPLRFSINDGNTLAGWVMNHSGAALTTGSIVTFTGTIFGRWQV